MRVLASALGRNVRDCPFQDLQQCLLNTFTRDVPSDRRIFVLTTDLVDFIDVDDACLGASYVAVSCLEQLEDDVLDILAHIPGFGEGRCVDDCERNIEHLGQCLRQQSFTAAGGADQHDVRLRQLHFTVAVAVHVDTFVVVVHRYCELLLRLVLANHVLVEECLYLGRLRQMIGSSGGMGLGSVIFKNGIANRNALVADVSARIVTW